MKAAALRFRSLLDDKSSGILFLFGNGRGPGAKEMMIGTFLIPPFESHYHALPLPVASLEILCRGCHIPWRVEGIGDLSLMVMKLISLF
ncbi:hypothetical protein TNCV_2714171 [Trichonephila clavipes]|nr:hypothetical protein TNCV_2714171 [Trichonephila clavipes]